MPVDRLARRNKFVINKDNGDYCDVTQIAYTSASRGHANDNSNPSEEAPDTKFTLIAVLKDQVVAGTITAEKITVEPVRIPENYSLLNPGDKTTDDVVAIIIEELDEKLVMLSEIIGEFGRQEISSKFRVFLARAIDDAVSHYHRALWASLTLDVVHKIPFDDGDDTHVTMINEARQPISPLTSPTCSECGQLINKGHANYMGMPCGDYCHIDCLWSWPREE